MWFSLQNLKPFLQEKKHCEREFEKEKTGERESWTMVSSKTDKNINFQKGPIAALGEDQLKCIVKGQLK